MNFDILKKAASKTLSKASQASPEILLGLGVLGFIGTIIEAAKASRKGENLPKELKEDLEIAANSELIPDNKRKAEIIKVGFAYSKKYAKTYGLTVFMGTASLLCFGASYKIQKGRYKDLKRDFENIAKAYSALDLAYRGLRKRIRDKFGEEAERELVFGDGSIGIKESYTDEETGKKRTKTVYKRKFDESIPKSPYTFIFSRDTVQFNKWKQNPEDNRMFLEHMENMANDLLFRRGYVFLYEILQDIDLRDTPESHVLGWVYDENRKDLANCIDFGFMEGYREAYRLDSDLCKEIRLDFNCDGNIVSGMNCYTNYRKD